MPSIFAALTLAVIAHVNTQPVLLEVGSDHCRPCREMRPVVNQLELCGLRVRHIDSDRDEAECQRLRVRATPTFICLRLGRETGRVVGKCSLARLRDLLHIPDCECEGKSTPQPDNTNRSVLKKTE